MITKKSFFYFIFALFLLLPIASPADSTKASSPDTSQISGDSSRQAEKQQPARQSRSIFSKELASPYHSIKNFKLNLSADVNKPELAAKSLKFDNGTKAQKSIELTKKLKEIFKGYGLIIHLEDYPRDKNHMDSTELKHVFIPFTNYPEIYLEKYGNDWKFSEETVGLIESMHSEIYPVTVDAITKSMPDFLLINFLGLHLWQYVGVAIYAALGLFLFYLLSFVFGKVILAIINKFHKNFFGDDFVKSAAKPASILVVSLLVYKFLPILALPFNLNIVLIYFLKIFIPLNVIYILIKFIDLLSIIFSRLAAKTINTIDDRLVPFARKALKALIIVLGIFYILKIFEIDITPLIAGVSIGGLAFALAAQDTVKNIFGSFTIFTDQPFNHGDWIIFKDGEGMVEEVGTRSTRIRTFANSQITIPNGRLSDMTINNMGRRKLRRWTTNVAVTYNTPTDKIQEFVEGIRNIIDENETTVKDGYHVYLNSFGDFSLNILIYLFFDVPDWAAELTQRHDMMMKIIKLAESIEVEFAFPTQSLLIEQLPELRIGKSNENSN